LKTETIEQTSLGNSTDFCPLESQATSQHDKKVFESPAVRANHTSYNRPGTVPVWLQMSMAKIPPRTYDARVNSQNWRGKPLVSHQVIVNLIAATTTKTELRVRAEIDPAKYPKGVKVSKREVAAIRLERDTFHGEWNDTILPRPD
jgi:hypothetical protein